MLIEDYKHWTHCLHMHNFKSCIFRSSYWSRQLSAYVIRLLKPGPLDVTTHYTLDIISHLVTRLNSKASEAYPSSSHARLAMEVQHYPKHC